MSAVVGALFGLQSTIANLVERLYDPQRGSITFGHVALPEVDHKYLHSQVRGADLKPTFPSIPKRVSDSKPTLPSTKLHRKRKTGTELTMLILKKNAHDAWTVWKSCENRSLKTLNPKP